MHPKDFLFYLMDLTFNVVQTPRISILKIIWDEYARNLQGRRGLIRWLMFLIKPLDLIDIWFNEDQKDNIIKTHV